MPRSILLAALLALVLSACGKTEEAAPTAEVAPAVEVAPEAEAEAAPAEADK